MIDVVELLNVHDVVVVVAADVAGVVAVIGVDVVAAEIVAGLPENNSHELSTLLKYCKYFVDPSNSISKYFTFVKQIV